MYRFGLSHLIAVNLWEWWRAIRNEKKELSEVNEVFLSHGSTITIAPANEPISLYDGWGAMASAAGAEFWVVATGQLIVAWVCGILCGIHTDRGRVATRRRAPERISLILK